MSVRPRSSGAQRGRCVEGAARRRGRRALAVASSLGAALLATAWTAPSTLAAPGALDTTFGTGGRQTVDFGGTDRATHVAVTPDGRVVAVGSTDATGAGDFAVTRLTADGRADGSFGTSGRHVVRDGGERHRRRARGAGRRAGRRRRLRRRDPGHARPAPERRRHARRRLRRHGHRDHRLRRQRDAHGHDRPARRQARPGGLDERRRRRRRRDRPAERRRVAQTPASPATAGRRWSSAAPTSRTPSR